MPIVEIHDAPDSFVRHWQELQRRQCHVITGPYLRALEALATVARQVVAHLDHNARRDDQDDYTVTCALLMRPDAPGGQLVDALTRIDLAAVGLAQPEEPDDLRAELGGGA